jgi:hypothetical protein
MEGTTVDFALTVVRNLRAIEEELKLLDKAIPVPEDFESVYKLEVEKLAKEYCVKDESGNPKLTQQGSALRYTFDQANQPLFIKALEELEQREDVAIIIKEKEKADKLRNELLEKEASIKLHKIDKDSLPKNITAKQLIPLYDIISE